MGYEKNAEGKISWNGLANVKLVKYWTAKSYGDMIKAFNVNTNDVSLIKNTLKLSFSKTLLSMKVDLYGTQDFSYFPSFI